MKLKEYVAVAALATASILTGCKKDEPSEQEQTSVDLNSECDELKGRFRGVVEATKWEGFFAGKSCPENTARYLDLSDIRQRIIQRCSGIMDIAPYETAFKAIEGDLKRHECIGS